MKNKKQQPKSVVKPTEPDRINGNESESQNLSSDKNIPKLQIITASSDKRKRSGIYSRNGHGGYQGL